MLSHLLLVVHHVLRECIVLMVSKDLISVNLEVFVSQGQALHLVLDLIQQVKQQELMNVLLDHIV